MKIIKVTVDELVAKIKADWGGGKPMPVEEFLQRFRDNFGTEPSAEAMKELGGKETVTFDEAWKVGVIHRKEGFHSPISVERINYGAAA
jgi:hypothetical protein